MHYTSFRIQNFKGIRDTTINLDGQRPIGIFAFVGLNESGKTTILEAIHSFAPDPGTSRLVGGKRGTGVPSRDRVPRHMIASFTGEVAVTATVIASEQERASLLEELHLKHGLRLESLPERLELRKWQRFSNGDFEKHGRYIAGDFQVKSGKQRNWREPDRSELKLIFDSILERAPTIAYFPISVFDFPKKIWLTDRGDINSNFYRQVFQDILDHDGQGLTIEKSIVSRIRGEDKIVKWTEFLSQWAKGDDKHKVEQVMDRASAAVTEVVFGRWNKIFGEDVNGKEVVITYDTYEGQKWVKDTGYVPTHEHDVAIKFQIKDGTRRFDVNDRSLGFRWFFAFMMFTQFRVARESEQATMFVFDEPASNLHAAAQQKLIDSFSGITSDKHVLIYSTHSHYMIEPKWLEQTFIVTNRADSPSESVLDGVSLSDESLDIKATRYRQFVSKYPSQTSYFQPVLDRLQVVPSRFDFDRPSVVLEGKSDYYIIRYLSDCVGADDMGLIPAFGASGSFDALVSLSIGWNLSLVFLWDGDPEGKSGRDKAMSEFGLSSDIALTIDEVCPGVLEIEDFFDEESRQEIARLIQLGDAKKLNKKQLFKFCQESLASGHTHDLGGEFQKRGRQLLEGLNERLTGLKTT